jgi:tRNA-specific 2-thiouridylase
VDSTVAALRLLRQGHEVEGITFWFWDYPGAPDPAGQRKGTALDSAQFAAEQLGIPHRTLDASDRFYERVIRDYVERYRRGETPNPCGRCNRFLRFGLALEIAARDGFDRVATGHHARIVRGADGAPELHRGADRQKDQSYFLYGLKQADLERLVFPVGAMTKQEVFAIAEEEGLHAARVPESQDLCFARAGHIDVLFPQEDLRPGPILDRKGRRLGTHRGLPRYTIGQRRGLALAAERPLYVVALDRERNAVIVGEEDALLADGLVAGDISFVDDRGPEDGRSLEVKLRYRSPAVAATYRRVPPDRFALRFQEPQRAVTPGQLAVLYHGDRLLGGGTILEATSRTA